MQTQIEDQSDQGLYCLPFLLHELEVFELCHDETCFLHDENKEADQLRGNGTADQCYVFTTST